MDLPQTNDPYELYSDLLIKAFDKIKKQAPKKSKELRDECADAIEKVKAEKQGPYDANKYFYIFKMGLELRIPKLMEHLLYIIQKLVTFEFLDGNCEDNCIYPEDQKPAQTNGRLPRLLIDAIVETICACVTERDSQVKLQVIKALLTIVTIPNSKVHEKSLLEAFRAQYQIHIISTSPINQNTAKASLTQMINIVFTKMEAFMANGDTVDLKKLVKRRKSAADEKDSAFLTKSLIGENLDNKLVTKANTATNNSNTSPEDSKEIQTITEGNIEGRASLHSIETPTNRTNTDQNQTISTNRSATQVNFQAIDQYVHGVVQNMVDNVCLYEARVDEIKQRYKEEETSSTATNPSSPTQKESSDGGAQSSTDRTQQMKEELAQIPLNCIPASSKKSKDDNCKNIQTSNKQQTKSLPLVSIQNEQGIESGKFGWCMVCRNKADLYCKETKHPVCSFDCKQKHLQLLNQIENNGNQPNTFSSQEARRHFNDALIVFKSICKLCLKEVPPQNMNAFAMRSKILGLELILAVVEKPGPTFLQRKEFIDIIQDTLCDGLLKYSVSNEKTIFTLSISIFYCLFLHFRQYLKQTIIVFIDTIFLKILDSGNSNYHHKFLILNIFDKLSQNTKHMLELFINYDCDLGEKDITEKMIDSLSRIANGKFMKSEHQNIISAQDEYSLRIYAIQILVQILRSFNASIEAETTESQVQQHRSSQVSSNANTSSAQQRSSLDATNKSNEEDQNNNSAENIGTQNMNQLQKTRNEKNEITKASQKFNFKPKIGIQFLVDRGMVVKEPYDDYIMGIVRFLKSTPQLDKTVIGEFLGEDKQFNKDVLFAFIDDIEFQGLQYIDALRTLLSGFRIKGEGQIVDRIMEKFGETYTRVNPETNMTAECIYLLSYATLMMQTSLHNPNAKKSTMTLEDFCKMVKGINNSKNLEPDFLQNIYDTIAKEPLTLDEDDEARMKEEAANATTYKRKQELFQKEGQGLVKRGADMMKNKNASSRFIYVNDTDPIGPFVEATWSANLATFSVILEEAEDSKIIDLGIEGFIHAIKISGYFNMDTEREAFVSSLSKCVQINTTREIKEKNIKCIEQLFRFAIRDGNYLRQSWYYVLDCLSKVEFMHQLGTGQIKDSAIFAENPRVKIQSDKRAQREASMVSNAEVIVQNIDVLDIIERIVANSFNLDEEAIIYFIEGLCKVSEEEMKDMENLRKFSLQKIVEVSDLNMDRIRYVWTKIWQPVSDHFQMVGSHANLNIAIYAIDCLRQLADKFLNKEEFNNFSFQKEFLKPFEVIMLNNLHIRKEIKEFIVMCIANICGTKTKNIKSGWSVIIEIFKLAAQDSEEHLVKQSFQALKLAVKNHFNLLEHNFVELVDCLSKYAENTQFERESLEAMDLLRICGEYLKKEPELTHFFLKKQGQLFYQTDQENMQRYVPHYGLLSEEIQAQKDREANNLKTQEAINGDEKKDTIQKQVSESDIKQSVLKGLWFPILSTVTGLMIKRSERNQEKAFSIMLLLFQEGVEIFSPSFWKEIFSQVLLPMLGDILIQVENPTKKNDEFFQVTIRRILENVHQFFIDYKKDMIVVLDCYFDIICYFLTEVNNKRISSIVVTQFQNLVVEIGSAMSEQNWNSLVKSLQLCMSKTLPLALLDKNNNFKDKQEELDSLFTRCITQMFLVGAVQKIMEQFYTDFSLDNVNTVMDALTQSHKFASQFNKDIDLRLQLYQVGFMADLDQLPGLIAQERVTLATLIQTKFDMYLSPKQQLESEAKEDSARQLFDLCQDVLKDYVNLQTTLYKIDQETMQAAQKEQQEKQRRQQERQRQAQENGADDDSEEDEVGEDGDSDDVDSNKTGTHQQIQQKQLEKLKEHELRRRLQNMTPVVSDQILSNLQKLSEKDLQGHIQQIGPLLIDLTLCNDYSIRLCNRELLSQIFNLLVQFKISEK